MLMAYSARTSPTEQQPPTTAGEVTSHEIPMRPMTSSRTSGWSSTPANTHRIDLVHNSKPPSHARLTLDSGGSNDHQHFKRRKFYDTYKPNSPFPIEKVREEKRMVKIVERKKRSERIGKSKVVPPTFFFFVFYLYLILPAT